MRSESFNERNKEMPTKRRNSTNRGDRDFLTPTKDSVSHQPNEEEHQNSLNFHPNFREGGSL